MLILGLLLLACTAAFAGLAIADNLSGGPDYDVSMFGHHLATMNGVEIFCAGLALALLFGIGAMLSSAGLALNRRTSRKLSAARRHAADTERERDELAARLDRAETPAPSTYPADDYSAGPDAAYSNGPDADRDKVAADTADPDPTRSTTSRRQGRHLFGH